MKETPKYDENGLIEKIANNQTNREYPNFNSNEEIEKKLDYYRSFFNKVQGLSDADFEKLKANFKTFFNIYPSTHSADAPQYLFRISNNNRICASLRLGWCFVKFFAFIFAAAWSLPLLVT